MSDTAFQIQYRQETINGFEQRQSLLRDSTTTEAVIKGNQATFLVADSGGATAVTRGVNGLIPSRADNLTQVTATLSEWHDKVIKTGFNIFGSQGNQRAIMQQTTMGVINRKIDDQIITQLNTGTVNTGTATTASLALVARARAILGVNTVPFDGNITLLMTPAMEAYLLQVKEFANAEYVSGKPMQSGETAWSDAPMVYKWMGMTLITHPSLPGVGTSAEKCFLYHKSAIGHAANTAGMDAVVDYDKEDDYSYCRASLYMEAKKLQNSGIVVINHDGSALAAA